MSGSHPCPRQGESARRHASAFPERGQALRLPQLVLLRQGPGGLQASDPSPSIWKHKAVANSFHSLATIWTSRFSRPGSVAEEMAAKPMGEGKKLQRQLLSTSYCSSDKIRQG